MPFGMVGPVDWCALEEGTIRARISEHPRLEGTDAWKKERPDPRRDHRTVHLRRHGLQRAAASSRRSATCARYIHFDEAWAGFGAFHPLHRRITSRWG